MVLTFFVPRPHFVVDKLYRRATNEPIFQFESTLSKNQIYLDANDSTKLFIRPNFQLQNIEQAHRTRSFTHGIVSLSIHNLFFSSILHNECTIASLIEIIATNAL